MVKTADMCKVFLVGAGERSLFFKKRLQRVGPFLEGAGEKKGHDLQQ